MSAGKDDPRPFSDFWPGTEGLVNVAITCYNRAFSTPNHQYTESFVEAFDKPYNEVSSLSVHGVFEVLPACATFHHAEYKRVLLQRRVQLVQSCEQNSQRAQPLLKADVQSPALTQADRRYPVFIYFDCTMTAQVAALTDLPIWIAETGTTSYGTNKPLDQANVPGRRGPLH
jgi:hypothetical protein